HDRPHRRGERGAAGAAAGGGRRGGRRSAQGHRQPGGGVSGAGGGHGRMIEDTGTVIWKELRELLRQRESLRGTALSFFIPVLFWGILLPAQSGLRWVESPATLAGWAMIALLLVTLVVAEAFAGERERHTLETLLATRLSDQAILFGKIAASV